MANRPNMYCSTFYIRAITLSMALLLGVVACTGEVDERAYNKDGRTILPLNKSWAFTLMGKEAVDSDLLNWKEVALPHTWNAKDGQNGGDDYHRGSGV